MGDISLSCIYAYFDHLTSCLNGMIVWLDWWAKSVKQAHLEDDVESVKILHSLCKCKHIVSSGHLPFMGYNLELSNPDDINLHSETESRRKHVSTSIANSSQSSLHTDPRGLSMPRPIWTHFETLNKSHKTLILGTITAREDNSIKSPCVAEAVQRKLCSMASFVIRAEVHRTPCLERKICMCVCVCVHKCIYNRQYTRDTHTHTPAKKYSSTQSVFSLHCMQISVSECSNTWHIAAIG